MESKTHAINDFTIKAVSDFVKSYQKQNYKNMRDGKPIESVSTYMLDYCEKLKVE